MTKIEIMRKINESYKNLQKAAEMERNENKINVAIYDILNLIETGALVTADVMLSELRQNKNLTVDNENQIRFVQNVWQQKYNDLSNMTMGVR